MSVPEFHLGATIALQVVADGDTGDVTEAIVRMKRYKDQTLTLYGDEPVAATFDVTPRVASGDLGAGWDAVLLPGDASGLARGYYAVAVWLWFGNDDPEVSTFNILLKAAP